MYVTYLENWIDQSGSSYLPPFFSSLSPSIPSSLSSSIPNPKLSFIDTYLIAGYLQRQNKYTSMFQNL